jgi:hypothetical protein
MEKQDLPVDSSRHPYIFTTCRPTSISERTTSWDRMVLVLVFPDDLDDFFLNNDVLLEGFATTLSIHFYNLSTRRPTSISERMTSWEQMVVFPDDLDDFFLNNDVLLEGFATSADP